MSHIDGPWVFEESFQCFDGDPADGTSATAFTEFMVRDALGFTVYRFYDDNTLSEQQLEAIKAKVILIAAAPDLLEALERLLPIADGSAPCVGGGYHLALDLARTAIAKATPPPTAIEGKTRAMKERLTFADWDEIGAELGKELTDRLYHEHVFHRPLISSLATMMAEFEGVAKRAGWSPADIDHKAGPHRAVLDRARKSEQ